MRKYLFLALAILFCFGVANAAEIPGVVDPQNAPEVWTTTVYNNYSADLTSGTVVVWDMGADTTDASYAYRTGWVTTTTTDNDINVAGVVVDGTLKTKSTGRIAIWGPVYTLVADTTDAVTANYSVGCANGVRGQAGDYAAGNNLGILGWAIYAAPVATAYGGGGEADGNDFITMPIFVDPHCDD